MCNLKSSEQDLRNDGKIRPINRNKMKKPWLILVHIEILDLPTFGDWPIIPETLKICRKILKTIYGIFTSLIWVYLVWHPHSVQYYMCIIVYDLAPEVLIPYILSRYICWWPIDVTFNLVQHTCTVPLYQRKLFSIYYLNIQTNVILVENSICQLS